RRRDSPQTRTRLTPKPMQFLSSHGGPLAKRCDVLRSLRSPCSAGTVTQSQPRRKHRRGQSRRAGPTPRTPKCVADVRAFAPRRTENCGGWVVTAASYACAACGSVAKCTYKEIGSGKVEIALVEGGEQFEKVG